MIAKTQKEKNKKGFVLLYAVLVSSLILAVGISLVSIALKQLSLSSVGRESQYAFYASNTGVECALFWDYLTAFSDINAPVFPTDENSMSLNSVKMAEDNFSFQCAKSIIYSPSYSPLPTGAERAEVVSGIDSATTTFSFKITDTDYCATVSVAKFKDAFTDTRMTVIDSRGYNTCDVNNPRRVERGLRVIY